MALGIKTGGRKKGVRNKATVEQAASIAASGLTPLEYMLQVLRNADAPLETRLDAAGKAAPYVHPKLAQIEHRGDSANPVAVMFQWLPPQS